MRKSIVLVTLLLIMVLPLKVNAECSINDQNELLKLSNQIKYKYKYVSDNQFKIVFNNVSDKLYIIDDIGLQYSNNEEKDLTYKGGFTRIFHIAANGNTNCSNEIIKDLTIRLPIYNKFSENEKCSKEEYKDFKYCNKFLYEEISEENWKKELSKYESKLEKNIITNDNNIVKIVIGIGLIVFTILTIGIIMIIRKRKRRKF